MEPAVKKQIDVTRLLADLSLAKVELLSAQCAADRVRLQYSPQDIAAYGDPQVLKRLISTADALHTFFSQVQVHLEQKENENEARSNE